MDLNKTQLENDIMYDCRICNKVINNPSEQFDMYGDIVCQDCYNHNQYQALQDMGGA
jgi:DNA-directed RNA polymerase subunit RPC12/RpoP